MSSTESKPSIALLGATGGSVLAFLVRALKDGYNCTALVRNPSKLTDLLKTNQITPDQIATHLTIISGDCKDTTKMTELVSKNPDIIISGVGSYPSFKNPLKPTLKDPTICQDTISTLLSSLQAKSHQSNPNSNSSTIPQVKKPLLIIISSCGISDHGRDVPIAMIPLYYWLLPIPHRDKKAMETLVINEKAKGVESVIEDYVIVRPQLLTDGEAVGVRGVRVGVERDGVVGREGIGYMVSRRDVGGWIFEVLVGAGGRREEFLGRKVLVTS